MTINQLIAGLEAMKDHQDVNVDGDSEVGGLKLGMNDDDGVIIFQLTHSELHSLRFQVLRNDY